MRYKYSQNLIEASEMTFAENEYQGLEQNGTMKRIPTTRVKQAINAELSGRLDTLEGTGYTEGSLKTHEDRLDTLEGSGEGSVAKAVDDAVSPIEERIESLDENKADKATTYTKTEVDVTIDALDTRVDTLEGTGEGSVEKAIDDAVSPLAEVVDTNRLYSDSQYLDLKAKYNAQQIALNASKAELYTDDPILQYGAVEIIGDGYEADDTPIDVSANVVDGSLELEQKGLTITNLVENGDFSAGFVTPWVTSLATVGIIANGICSFTPSAKFGAIRQTFENARVGDVFCVIANIKAQNTNVKLELWESAGNQNTVNISDINVFQTIAVLRTKSIDNNIMRGGVWDESGSGWEEIHVSNFRLINLTALGLDHITDTAILAKLLPYVDGTQNMGKMGVQILDADDAVTQTIFLPSIGNSLPNGVADSVKTVADGWEHTQRVYTPEAVGSGVAVNTTNYPTAKNGGQWVNELTAGGTEIGVVGTDSTAGAGMLRFELATPIVTHYDLPHLTSGRTIHRFAGEEKIALYGTGLTFSENVLSVLSAVKFVAGVMTDITDLATITDDTVTFSGVNATDVVYVKVEHDVDRPLGILEHTPPVSNTASRLASLEARVSALEV